MSAIIVTRPYAQPMSLTELKLAIKQDLSTDDALITGWLGDAVAAAEHQTRHALVATRYRQPMDAFPDQIVLARRPVVEVVSIQYVDDEGVTQTLATDQYQVDTDDDSTRIVPAYGVSWPSTRDQLSAVTVTFIAGHAAPFTADAAANAITVRGWKALVVNDVLRLTNSGGALPAPLAVDTDYYVQSVVSAGVYTLAATAGGAAIDLTSAGTGTHYLGAVPEGIKSWIKVRIGGLDKHRQETVTGTTVAPVPFIDRLLDPFRAYGFSD